MLLLFWELVILIHWRAAFRSAELQVVDMVASYGIAHEIMHHLYVGSDASG